uniref:Uncharacterized protein MANES_08G136500 n=1 Tax=Rhizophora mucronata TaxID=61149 RepID=A0A2P2MGW4_RHIMU
MRTYVLTTYLLQFSLWRRWFIVKIRHGICFVYHVLSKLLDGRFLLFLAPCFGFALLYLQSLVFFL